MAISVETVGGVSVVVDSVSSSSGRVQATTNIKRAKYESCRFISKFPRYQRRRACFWSAKRPAKSTRKQRQLQLLSSNVIVVHNHNRPRRPPKQPSLTPPAERTHELDLLATHYSTTPETFPALSLSTLQLHHPRLPQLQKSHVTPLTNNKRGQRSDARTKSAIDSRRD